MSFVLRLSRQKVASPHLVALLVLTLDCAILAISSRLGPYVPMLVFHIVLVYAALRFAPRPTAYLLAILAASGRTLIHADVLPEQSFGVLFAWQWFNNAATLLIICYLLDRAFSSSPQPRSGNVGDEIRSTLQRLRSPIHGRRWTVRLGGAAALLAILLAIAGQAGFASAGVNGAHVVSRATIGALGDDDGDTSMRDRIAMLTIDDGPRDAASDRELLAVLQRHAAKAVWLVNCANFDGLAAGGENTRTLREIRDAGHVIGNHSYEHVDLNALAERDPERMIWEIDQCSLAIQLATGSRPRYFRAPWGEANPSVVAASNRAGMVYMGWSVSFDSLFGFRREAEGGGTTAADGSVADLADTVESGDIVLLHDDSRSAPALDAFLTALERRGFRFVLPAPEPTRNWIG